MCITRKTEIDFDSVIAFDKYITKRVYDKTLIFFYELPNWIVLSDKEFKVFEKLTKVSVSEAIEQYSEEIIKKVLVKFFERKILPLRDDGNDSHKKIVMPMHIYLTNKCNLTCTHCYMYAGKPLENELEFQEWKKLVSDFIEYGGNELSISGGEPLLVDFLPVLLKFAKTKKPSLYIKAAAMNRAMSLTQSSSPSCPFTVYLDLL